MLVRWLENLLWPFGSNVNVVDARWANGEDCWLCGGNLIRVDRHRRGCHDDVFALRKEKN